MASGKQAFLITILIIGLISNVFAQSIIQIFPENLISDDRKALAGDDGLFCDSWRLSVETNNAGVWSTIPDRCISYVQHYMTGDKYRSDSEVVAGDSLAFAKTVEIAGDGLYAWVFDIDETLLSNLPYYTYHGFGSESFNETAFDEWVDLAEAPALPASLSLYKALQQLGFKIVLLTGRGEYQRNATETNLLLAGFSDWEKLFLRGASDQGKPAVVYKSEKRSELMNEGYNIHGSSGDQWSDLLGFALAHRSFKLPNPMYYIG